MFIETQPFLCLQFDISTNDTNSMQPNLLLRPSFVNINKGITNPEGGHMLAVLSGGTRKILIARTTEEHVLTNSQI